MEVTLLLWKPEDSLSIKACHMMSHDLLSMCSLATGILNEVIRFLGW